jgi:glycosyltransferase involved in cell wall biosynthesis
MAGIPADKMDVVPNGLDISRFECDRRAARERLVAEFTLRQDACLFGIVAQLRPRKHHDLLFRAVRAAADQEPAIHLLVIGDGTERGRLHTLKTDLNLDLQVTMAGYRQDISEILAGLDGFVLPSSLEGSPVSLMEAMAAGLPVIAAAAGGVAELVTHAVTGILVEPGNEAALTHALLTLARDAALRSELGTAAREKIRTEFTLEAMARRIESVYDRVLEG